MSVANSIVEGAAAPVEPTNPGTLADPFESCRRDYTLRERAPYPVAALYALAENEAVPAQRRLLTINFIEGTLRFLALVNLANAARCRDSGTHWKKWLGCFESPTVGKLLYVLESTTRFLRENDSLFLRPLAGLFDGEWGRVSKALTEQRNGWAHPVGPVLDDGGSDAGPGNEVNLQALSASVAFLAGYSLGRVDGLNNPSGVLNFQWRAAVGGSELGRVMRLSSEGIVISDVPTLVEVATGRTLAIEPFIDWYVAPGDSAPRWWWLVKLDADAPTMARPATATVTSNWQTRSRDGNRTRTDGGGFAAYVTPPNRLVESLPWRLTTASKDELMGVAGALPSFTKYVVRRQLGRGGAGTVYEADDTSLRRRCALKVLGVEGKVDRKAITRFRKEAEALARFDDPRVVKVYETIEYCGRPVAIAMAVVDGEDLQSVVQRDGAMPVERAVELTVEALEALQVVHEKDVVHRDVKPANFIRTSQGVLKLVDFGVARLSDSPTVTEAHDVVGTKWFVSPEQLAGEATPRSDLFAAGRLLFNLVRGRLPRDDREPLDEGARDEIPAALAAVYLKATQRRPEDRYASAREMADALRRALDRNARTGGFPPQPGDPFGPFSVTLRLQNADAWVTMAAERRGAHGFSRASEVKILKPAAFEDPGLREAFYHEAFVLGRVRHPGVVGVEDLLEAEGLPYMVLEPSPRVTLASLLKTLALRGERIPQSAAVAIAASVATALHALHEARDPDGEPLEAVHAFVWPKAVLVDRDGLVKLAGFERLRSRRSRPGTPEVRELAHLRYLTPEQARGGPIDRRSDVYGVGLLAWEMLAMIQAARSGDRDRLLSDARAPKIPRISDVVAGVSPELARAVDAALAVEPEGRHPTTQAFATCLRAAPEARGDPSQAVAALVASAAMQ